jgi:hypothetical protein
MGRVWDLGESKTTTALVAALLTVILFAGACSGEDSAEGPGSTGRTTGSEEDTLISSTTGREKTEPPEATLGAEPASPGVVLRLEGDPRTTFSGICTVGERESVLSGRVPKRYAFDPEGEGLSCRIQKQDRDEGSLKVILSADDTTRSVQQTNVRGGVISISYKSN